ncbi:hypothetical protein ACOME3_005075 [Neoechinorhynchus agilis]
MKALARMFLWFPRMNKAIDDIARRCGKCQEVKPQQPEVDLIPWDMPQRPWERVQIDYAEPIKNNTWLIVVDAFTKWPEVVEVRSTDAVALVMEMRRLFCRFGLRKRVVMDNGASFRGEHYKGFLIRNGIKPITPLHTTRGLTARQNGSCGQSKIGYSSVIHDQSSRKRCSNSNSVAAIVLRQKQKISPAMAMLGRLLKVILNNIRRDERERVAERKENLKTHHDRQSSWRQFEENQPVWFRAQKGHKWEIGNIVNGTGPVSYQVESNDTLSRRHVDHLRPATTEDDMRNQSYVGQPTEDLSRSEEGTDNQNSSSPRREMVEIPGRSERVRRPSNWLKDYVT